MDSIFVFVRPPLKSVMKTALFHLWPLVALGNDSRFYFADEEKMNGEGGIFSDLFANFT